MNDRPKTFARKPDARWEDFFHADGVPLDDAPTHTIVPPGAEMIPWPGRNARRHLHFGMEATTVREAELAVSAIVRRWHWIEPSNRFVLAPQAVIDALADFSWEEPQFTESHGWGSVVMRPLAEFALQMIPSDDLTPAGLLLTELLAMGVKGCERHDNRTISGEESLSLGSLLISLDGDDSWAICGSDGDGHTAANAIAAIVQAPGLRAELAAIRDALIDQGARPKEFLPPHAERTTLDMLNGLMAAGNQTAQEFMDLQREHAKERGALTIERDTLAAEVKRLREEAKPAINGWEDVPGLYGFTRYDNPRSRLPQTLRSRASVKRDGWIVWDIFGDKIATGPETGDAGRHAADLALLAAGYRLVGGVHPLPDEVRS